MKNKIYAVFLTAVFLFPQTAAWGQYADTGSVDSLSLQAYLSRVASGNLDYLAERYNINIAEAEVIAQKIFPDPTLSFEATEDAYLLELGYTVEAGKRGARIRAARSAAEIETLGVELFYQELRAEAAGAYMEALLQKELLEVTRSSYEYMAQLARYDSLRFAAGEITEIDARQSALEASTLLNEVFQQEGCYRSALALLNLYTGRDCGELYSISGTFDGVRKDYDLLRLIQLGLENRVDLKMSVSEIEFAMKNLKLIKAERRPDIDIFVGFERDWKGFAPKRDMLRAGVSIPLSFSNINKGEVRQAKYALDQSRLRSGNAELMVQTEIAQAYYQYEALGKQVDIFRSGMLLDAAKVLEGMTFSYKRGETGILDVLIAQRTYNEIREQYLEKEKEYMLSLIEIQRSCGIWELDN